MPRPDAAPGIARLPRLRGGLGSRETPPSRGLHRETDMRLTLSAAAVAGLMALGPALPAAAQSAAGQSAAEQSADESTDAPAPQAAPETGGAGQQHGQKHGQHRGQGRKGHGMGMGRKDGKHGGHHRMHHGAQRGPTLAIRTEFEDFEIDFECNAPMPACLEAIERVYAISRRHHGAE
ncbi:hypothetical protein LNKW23_41390 [Paralimibaculum aggregatum]|uniref:Uncharacterized protein n=2 Tax=Paralimibaculum aggregatum TaxID=3036245 RepID=A0ABQ6LS27_9RHOB|nr:hypothetical protein LNKW23_41390 [Limibaculum sp. NKW23]